MASTQLQAAEFNCHIAFVNGPNSVMTETGTRDLGEITITEKENIFQTANMTVAAISQELYDGRRNIQLVFYNDNNEFVGGTLMDLEGYPASASSYFIVPFTAEVKGTNTRTGKFQKLISETAYFDCFAYE